MFCSFNKIITLPFFCRRRRRHLQNGQKGSRPRASEKNDQRLEGINRTRSGSQHIHLTIFKITFCRCIFQTTNRCVRQYQPQSSLQPRLTIPRPNGLKQRRLTMGGEGALTEWLVSWLSFVRSKSIESKRVKQQTTGVQ